MNKVRNISIAVTAILISGCATVQERAPEIGQGMDVATTVLAQSVGASEANPLVAPLFGHPASAIAYAAVKVALPIAALNLEEDQCRIARNVLSSLGWGASAWNIAVIASASTGVGVVAGLVGAVGGYTLGANDKLCTPKQIEEKFVNLNLDPIPTITVVYAHELNIGDMVYSVQSDGAINEWATITDVQYSFNDVEVTTDGGWSHAYPTDTRVSTKR